MTSSKTQAVVYAFVVWAFFASSNSVEANDWPQFLGPNRNGTSNETDLLNEWPEGGPEIAWETDLGVGMSGIAIVGDQLFTMYQNMQHQYVACLNATTGEPIWETPIADHYRNQMGNGPRATPTVSDDHVFAYTGEGILVALDRETGDELWKRDSVGELDGKPADYGMACSPLVIGDRVVVTVGSTNGTMAAYEIDTGERAWACGSDRAGYSSPALLNVDGSDQIVAVTGNSVLGVDPSRGVVLWRHPFETDYDCNTATPIEIDGRVFISSGENHGSILLEIRRTAAGMRPVVVWESLGRDSVMRNEWQTSIVHEGHLYGLDNVGSAGAITHLNCIDLASGERVWQEVRFGKSNMIAADGKLFFSTMEGELVVVRLSAGGYDEIGRMQVLETTRQAPALSNGRLYFRDDEKVVCVDVRE